MAATVRLVRNSVPLRALAAATGVLWIGLAAVRATRPAYWSPVTIVDYTAVGLFSLAMLGLGLCLWLVPTGGRIRVVAGIAAAAAITNSVANFLEDWFALRPFGGVWVISALALVAALIALTLPLVRSGARGYGAVAAATVLGLLFIEAGGAALVGAAWLGAALSWPAVLWKRDATA